MKTKKGVLARMLTYTRPYGIYLVFALVFAVLQVLLTLYAPVLSGRAVDFIVGPGNVDFPAIGEILIQFAVVILLSAGFQWLMALCTNIVTGNTVRDIREAAFGKLETIPLSYIDGAARGDLMSRVVTDVDMISDGLLQGFSQLFTGVVTVFGTIGFMLSLSPAIAAVVVVLTPVSLFVSSFIARGVSRSFREQSTIRGRLGGFVEEMLGSQSVVKAFGYEQRAQARFDEVNEHLNKVGLRAQFFSAMVNPCTRFVNGLVYAAVGIFGALRVIAGGLSVGGLSAFLVYANQYTKPFNEISGVIAELQSAIAGARRVFELLDVEPEPPDAPDAVALESCAGRVELDDVSFSYRRDEKLIEHMSFAVEPGQRIAIVGPTGCGKTTLINLLMRFYDVDGGEIRWTARRSGGCSANLCAFTTAWSCRTAGCFPAVSATISRTGARTRRWTRSWRPPRPRTPTDLSSACRRATTPLSARATETSRRARNSFSVLRASCSRVRPCSSSTRRQAPLTPAPRSASRRRLPP